jgi:tetratricopeptide (TPR) repeat protein
MRAVVVYVHGLWLSGVESVVLRRRLERALNIETRAFAYSSVSVDLTGNARALRSYLRGIRTDRLHLVAHSLGGLVVLRLFELIAAEAPARAPAGAELPAGRVVLMGSPVRGSEAARRFARLPGGRRMLGLTAGEVLLNPAERRWSGVRELGVIAGEHAMGLGRVLGRMPSASDGTVQVAETELPGATEQIRLYVSHSGMVFSAEVARQVAAFLRDGQFELASRPASAELHYRRANGLKDQGSLEAAVAAYEQAIELQPDNTRALCNQAVVLGQLQRFSEALARYDRAISIDSKDALIHCNRGMLLNAMGQKDAALGAFDAAIACNADFFAAHFGRGALLQERRQWLDSLASYDRAIALNSRDWAAQFNRAEVLRRLERWVDALTGYDRTIALKADFALGHYGRAESLRQLNRLEEALNSYDVAIKMNPRDATIHVGRGVVLQKMSLFVEAMASYNEAIALDARSSQAYFNRGTLLGDSQDFAAASADFENAIAIDPTFAEAHLNLALTLLKRGDFLQGWAHYEWRWRISKGPILIEHRTFAEPLWLGEEDIDGRTILIYGEQGLGDSLQFCRFCERLASLGARVLLEVPEPLSSVCSTLRGVSQVISRGDRLPPFDCRCPLMSLPFALKVTLETIPVKMPYLHSDPHKVAAWRERLGAKTKPRVGLTWSGSQGSRTFSPRSYPLAKLIAHLPHDFQYFCTQTEITSADQATLTDATLTDFPGVCQFPNELKDFSDTAALCECLDLVITMDTSIAHLNGALGRCTWVLVPYDGDWRWLQGREDSPWYPTVRLFRQTTRGDWDGVFRRVAEQLQLTRDFS